MKILLDLVTADRGSVFLQGQKPSSPLSRKGVRYLPENITFPPWATPLTLFRQLERIRRECSRRQFLDRCSELQCRDLVKRPVGKMSRGQRQRVALSLITCGEPVMVFLDEPSSGLDPGGRILVRNLIGDLGDQGCTVLINSHLLGEVERVCHRAAFINRGRLVASGDLDSLSRQKGAAFIETSDPQTMQRMLSAAGYSSKTVQRGVQASLSAEGDFPGLVRQVLDSELQFSGVSRMRETLEDVFLRIMDDKDVS